MSQGRNKQRWEALEEQQERGRPCVPRRHVMAAVVSWVEQKWSRKRSFPQKWRSHIWLTWISFSPQKCGDGGVLGAPKCELI